MERNIILKGLVGSKAYGLSHVNSDDDYAGIYVVPFDQAVGLRQPLQIKSITSSNPDTTLHEVTKYVKLATECNPTVLELLWLDDYVVRTALGDSLIAMRSDFFSTDAVKGRYLGYATNQLERYWRAPEDNRKPKHIRHCFRLMVQAMDLLKTGTLTVRLSSEQATMVREISTMPEDLMREVFAEWEAAVLDAASSSILPDSNKIAKDKAQGFLVQLRRSQARYSDTL